MVREIQGGTLIGDLSSVVCIVIATSLEGEWHYGLAAGEVVAVIGITKPIEAEAAAE